MFQKMMQSKFFSLPYILILPFILNLGLLPTNYWGFQKNQTIVFVLNLIFLASGILLHISENYKSIWDIFIPNLWKRFFPYILGIQLLLFILIPVLNLNYGDGILLLENVLLESKVFGFQITLDEFWEAFIHSFIFQLFSMEDPRTSYRIISTLAGFFYLFLGIYFFKQSRDKIPLLLTPTVLLLFYGYSENYTIITLLLFLSLLLGKKWIQEEKNESYILLFAIIASISASFHLVYGYMLPALIYFTYKLSKTNQTFLRNGFLAGIMGMVYLGLLFGYFLFVSDPTTSPSQTHVLSPPLYPWKRWISTRHFLEISGVLWFTSLFAVALIAGCYGENKVKFQSILSSPENRFLLWAVFGFFIHAFFHNPSLGFPADWDLFSFYSLPLLLVAIALYPIWKNYKAFVYHLALYSILFQVSTAFALNENTVDLESDYRTMLTATNDYIKQNKEKIQSIDKSSKKMYVKLDHFLFKVDWELTRLNNPGLETKKKEYLTKVNKFQRNLESHIHQTGGQIEKIFLKDFLKELTEFHHQIIEIRKEDKKYHLEK